ncbi:MAG: hypothetical protein FJ272_08855 [Planctomycetes bacterium]|nr:hypothetical protein [Planctomycetota bacterium]
MSYYLRPLIIDMNARYEPESGYFVSAGIEKKFAELAARHTETVLFGGHYGGVPRLYTEPHGLSASTRIDVGRMIWSSTAIYAKIEEVLMLFREAQECEVASGGVISLRFVFNTQKNVKDYLNIAKEAFVKVYGPEFGDDPVFYDAYSYFELGKAKIHQSLREHIYDSGPYNYKSRLLLEKLQTDIVAEEGTYEQVVIYTVIKRKAEKDEDRAPRLVYACEERKPVIEERVQKACERPIEHIRPSQVKDFGKDICTFKEYLVATRRHGTVYLLKDDIIRSIKRDYVALLVVFIEAQGEPMDWQTIFEKIKQSTRVSKAYSESASYVDLGLEDLLRADLVAKDQDLFRLTLNFDEVKHATYYTLGEYRADVMRSKRLVQAK